MDGIKLVHAAEVNISRNALSVGRILDREAAELRGQGSVVMIITITPEHNWRVEINQQRRVIEISRPPS
jgi:hypothetical protein